MNHSEIVIVSAKRTPLGHFQGYFADLSAPELGSIVINGVLGSAHCKPEQIDEVYMGCVLPAGLGQAPARQAALGAAIPKHVPCTTVNKMCGSGMKTIMLAHDAILAGTIHCAIAGGMESMTNAPYLLPKAREGYRIGHQCVIDHMFFDGLEDAYDKDKLMGYFADQCAKEYQITREMQDQYAITSLARAKKAEETGCFKAEIIPVSHAGKTIDKDEGPGKGNPEKIPTLKPAFSKEGTVTAANASSISDGAAACLLTSQGHAEAEGLTPVAKILAHASSAQAPALFPTAPIPAIKQVLSKTNWSLKEVDLFEINEAFAVVPLVVMQALNIPHEKVNVHGGACVLGHPIGASGARIVATLINALQKRKLKRGIASICIGGGEATALAIEIK